MTKTQRSLTLGLWGLVVASLIGLIAMMRLESARADRSADPAGLHATTSPVGTVVERLQPLDVTAPAFSLTDQQNKPFDSATLKGKVWTASFFFSRCEGVCPGMLSRIHQLQQAIPSGEVHNVYFTVDPTRDTPERLAEYAAEAKADPAFWHMLTGTEAQMQAVAAGFQKPYLTPAMHSAAIILVGRDGKVVGYYESKHADQMIQLANDIRGLLGNKAAS